MSTPWSGVSNPGLDFEQLTSAEVALVQQLAGLGDPNADRILFWDDSAGSYAYLTAGTGLTITNTTITASGAIDGSGTTNEIAYWTDSDTLGALAVATYPSLTELSYVKGVTSAIQTQLNARATTAGALTQFVGNGNWKVWYSDGSGDVTELALGADGTYLRSNGAAAIPTFDTPAGSGDVSKVGTPANNQMAVWTGDGTLEGTSDFTYDGTSLNLITAKNFQIAGATVLADAAGTTTLSNIDALDATTEATIEAAIDTLANLTSIQGRTVTLADAGANAIFGWDDVAGAYENLTQAEVLAVIGDSTETAKGVIELATDAETVTGTDTARATTPANITAKMAAPGAIGGTTPAAITGTTITANTGFMPDANDGAYLGQAGTAFADLFLAEGAVINWDSGDATLTQTGNVLALAGADLRVATADVGTNADSVPTLSSTSTLTNKTLTSPTLTTPSAFTTGGTITLAENTSIALDPAGSADGKYTGITIAGTAGATLAFGDLVYLAAADSRWELADADAASTADRMMGMCVLAAASDGDPTVLLLIGQIRADAAFPALTIGSPVYVGETAGDIQTSIPTGADNIIRKVGFALTADEIYFCPSMDAQVTVA